MFIALEAFDLDRRRVQMARCSRCGKAMGDAKTCPYCGAGPSKSVVDKNVDRVAKATGKALEKGVEVTDKVVKGATPVVKTVARETKKGLKMVREETLKVARSLKEDK